MRCVNLGKIPIDLFMHISRGGSFSYNYVMEICFHLTLAVMHEEEYLTKILRRNPSMSDEEIKKFIDDVKNNMTLDDIAILRDGLVNSKQRVVSDE